MNTKLKITLGVLLLAAGFMVTRVGLFLNNSTKNASLSLQGQNVLSATDENPFFIDTDGDGIPDYDEPYYRTDPSNPDTDGDGYLDGEEVASECSPIIPRPNDCPDPHLIGFKGNLTDQVSDLLVGGLYSGDLKNPESNKDFTSSIGLVSSKVFLDFDSSFADQTSIADLNISENSDVDVVASYIENTVNILEKTILRPQQEQINEIKKGLNFMLLFPEEENEVLINLRDTYTKTHQDLLALNVPPDWKYSHSKLVNSINRFALIYSYISNPEIDPVASILSFEKLIDEFYAAQSILDELRVKADSYNQTSSQQ